MLASDHSERLIQVRCQIWLPLSTLFCPEKEKEKEKELKMVINLFMKIHQIYMAKKVYQSNLCFHQE
jgi:hypothetical protein